VKAAPRRRINEPQHRQKAGAAATRRCRAAGRTELLAHGFKAELLAGLVRDGLASTMPESVRTGGRAVAIARLRITDAGQRALALR
jgi:hypothetical protein